LANTCRTAFIHIVCSTTVCDSAAAGAGAAASFVVACGSRAPDRLSRGALGRRVTTLSAHSGHTNKPLPFCSMNSSSEANQPSKAWPLDNAG